MKEYTWYCNNIVAIRGAMVLQSLAPHLKIGKVRRNIRKAAAPDWPWVHDTARGERECKWKMFCDTNPVVNIWNKNRRSVFRKVKCLNSLVKYRVESDINRHPLNYWWPKWLQWRVWALHSVHWMWHTCQGYILYAVTSGSWLCKTWNGWMAALFVDECLLWTAEKKKI